jgi:hypothetical protein
MSETLTAFLDNAFIFGAPRSINGMIPDCAIEEHHSDRLMITRHPVEKGAEITDHAYAEPPTVTLRWAWSEALKGEGWARQIYEMILTLQKQRVVFTLMTGKRIYKDMLLEVIEETTDRTSEYGLYVELTCRQILVVSTQSTNLPPSENQAVPAQTSAMQDAGRQTAVPDTSGNVPIIAGGAGP